MPSVVTVVTPDQWDSRKEEKKKKTGGVSQNGQREEGEQRRATLRASLFDNRRRGVPFEWTVPLPAVPGGTARPIVAFLRPATLYCHGELDAHSGVRLLSTV